MHGLTRKSLQIKVMRFDELDLSLNEMSELQNAKRSGLSEGFLSL